ncbi:hypothetical protein LCGC14_2230090, partial [marine sediment metagenome]
LALLPQAIGRGLAAASLVGAALVLGLALVT